jgi:type IV pilus assembly protein PilP
MTPRMTLGLGMVMAVALGAAARAEQAQSPDTAIARAVEPADARYDPAGRRDPFRPLRGGGRQAGEPRTPLQRYELGQLKLVAIIYDTRDPRAVVEDEQGLGYIVKVGTPIGPNGGQVRAIERGRVTVAEESVDYYGEARVNEVAMELRTAQRGNQ